MAGAMDLQHGRSMAGAIDSSRHDGCEAQKCGCERAGASSCEATWFSFCWMGRGWGWGLRQRLQLLLALGKY